MVTYSDPHGPEMEPFYPGILTKCRVPQSLANPLGPNLEKPKTRLQIKLKRRRHRPMQ